MGLININIGDEKLTIFVHRFFDYLIRDKRKILSEDNVIIGIYKTKKLWTDIRATIVLENITPKDEGIFLDRVFIIDPYCPKCKAILNKDRVRSAALGRPVIGFRCYNCNREYGITDEELINNVKGYVRKNYNKLIIVYQEKINELTRGEPKKYKLRYD